MNQAKVGIMLLTVGWGLARGLFKKILVWGCLVARAHESMGYCTLDTWLPGTRVSTGQHTLSICRSRWWCKLIIFRGRWETVEQRLLQQFPDNTQLHAPVCVVAYVGLLSHFCAWGCICEVLWRRGLSWLLMAQSDCLKGTSPVCPQIY